MSRESVDRARTIGALVVELAARRGADPETTDRALDLVGRGLDLLVGSDERALRGRARGAAILRNIHPELDAAWARRKDGGS